MPETTQPTSNLIIVLHLRHATVQLLADASLKGMAAHFLTLAVEATPVHAYTVERSLHHAREAATAAQEAARAAQDIAKGFEDTREVVYHRAEQVRHGAASAAEQVGIAAKAIVDTVANPIGDAIERVTTPINSAAQALWPWEEEALKSNLARLGKAPPEKALAILLLASSDTAQQAAVAAAEEAAAEERARQADRDVEMRREAEAEAGRLEAAAEEEALCLMLAAEGEVRRLREQAKEASERLLSDAVNEQQREVAKEEGNKLYQIADAASKRVLTEAVSKGHWLRAEARTAAIMLGEKAEERERLRTEARIKEVQGKAEAEGAFLLCLAEEESARVLQEAEAEATRLKAAAKEREAAHERVTRATRQSQSELASGHNNVARSVLSEELRILDEDAAEARAEAAEKAAEEAARVKEAMAAAREEAEEEASRVVAEAAEAAARMKSAAQSESERLKEVARNERDKQEAAKEAAKEAARANELRVGMNHVARSVLSDELRLYDEECKEQREAAAEEARVRIEEELQKCQDETVAMREASEKQASRMQKRAAGLYREKEAEVRRMLEVEMEKAERLKAFNHVARRLMREELRVMDLEERQAYKDQLEEEMASERANSRLERANRSTSASASTSTGGGGGLLRSGSITRLMPRSKSFSTPRSSSFRTSLARMITPRKSKGEQQYDEQPVKVVGSDTEATRNKSFSPPTAATSPSLTPSRSSSGLSSARRLSVSWVNVEEERPSFGSPEEELEPRLAKLRLQRSRSFA